MLAPPPVLLSSFFFELWPLPLLGLFVFWEASDKGALAAVSPALAALDGVCTPPNARRDPMYNASPARFKDGADAQPAPSVFRALPGALFSIGCFRRAFSCPTAGADTQFQKRRVDGRWKLPSSSSRCCGSNLAVNTLNHNWRHALKPVRGRERGLQAQWRWLVAT